MKQRIVLLGPPASGKGTYAAWIRTEFDIPGASTGAILRAEFERGTPAGIEAHRHTSLGNLAPDGIVLEVVERWLDEQDGRFLFDGFPRTLPQGVLLEELLARRGTPLDLAILMVLPFELILARVGRRVYCATCRSSLSIGLHVEAIEDDCSHCGARGSLRRRPDDTPEVLERRMEVYHEITEPLVPFYRERGILREIPVDQEPAAIHNELRAILASPA